MYDMSLTDRINYYTTPARRLDAATLKRIACILMFIDHLTYTFLESYSPETGRQMRYMVPNGVLLDAVGRAIGRSAMPIFAFLIAESLYYTRSKARYLLRMTLFAIVAEPAFWLMERGIEDHLELNVMFTFAYAIVAVWIVDTLVLQYLRREDGARRGLLWRVPVSVAAVAGICYFAEKVIYSDYGAYGVIVVLLFYVFHNVRFVGMVGAYLTLLSVKMSEVYALPGMILIWLHNGQRGRQNKYFFYLFYPGHILVIRLIRYLVWGY